MTTKKPLKAKVKKKREVHTYSDLWYGSEALLQRAQAEPYWLWMGCLIFTAFSLEAYLNHIGPKLFAFWELFEKALSPESKLAIVCERLEIDLPKRKRPWQTVRNLFEFRNKLAHGKTVPLPPEVTFRDVDQYLYEFMGERPLATWEKYCTEKNAVKARKDIEEVIRMVHEKAGLENDPLFSLGFTFYSASLQQDS